MRIKLKPREYQVEAFKWASSRRGSVICMPTGTGKTLIAVLWVKRILKEGLSKRVLVLEPTRVLAEQVARYFRRVASIDAVPLYGVYPSEVRRKLLARIKVAVMTPEAALSNAETLSKEGYNAVVIDECHHTTGKDAYLQLISMLNDVFKWRLGLSAYIPPSRVPIIEKYIGEIRFWGWGDPKVRPYIPKWIGEIYEADLNRSEMRVLEILEKIRNCLKGKERLLVNLAIRWFVRDGALALRESLSRPTKLSSLLMKDLKDSIFDPGVRPAHKLDALLRVLRDHEGFRKSIIFIDRVIVAKYVTGKLRKYGTELICGKSHLRRKLSNVLTKIKASSTKVIVSTSAGEEGIDLPECDLLVIWSNVASPLRFIQRHGRVLRATGSGLPTKFVVYLITPNTVDTDSFIDSVEYASKLGIDIPVDKEVIEELWRRSTRAKILSVLMQEPLTMEWLHEITGIPKDILRQYIGKLLKHGDLIYIFTHLGKVYVAVDSINLLNERYSNYLTPDENITAKVKVFTEEREITVKGSYYRVKSKLCKTLESVKVINKVLVSLEVPLPGGAFKLLNIQYSFRITNSNVLDLVLRNAYSKETHYSIH